MSNLMAASKQWSSRPDDERFVGLYPLRDQMKRWKEESRALVVANRDIEVAPVQDSEHRGLMLAVHPRGLRGDPSLAVPTHWSFGQLCGLVKAPAGYLRSLPAEMAADCVNFGLKTREVEEAGLLLRQNGALTASAVTGPRYGRIYNADVVDALIRAFGNGLDGNFRVPGEFGERVEITKRNTTIYASDRDMFVFLADEDRRIEIPGRRAGKHGSFARGIMVWNSEVGASTFGVASFLHDYTCCNRIIWGVTHYKEITFRHSVSAPHRFAEEVSPRLALYAKEVSEQSEKPEIEAIKNATAKRLRDREAVDSFLANRFTSGQAKGIKLAHEAEEDRPIESAWDVVVGATAYAKSIPYQNERVDVERAAGKILEHVA